MHIQQHYNFLSKHGMENSQTNCILTNLPRKKMDFQIIKIILTCNRRKNKLESLKFIKFLNTVLFAYKIKARFQNFYEVSMRKPTNKKQLKFDRTTK